MSGSTFNAQRKNRADGFFQNAHLVPAPSFSNIYGGTVGATATAAVTFAKTINYSDEGVGGMKVAASFTASAASTIPAATISLALYRTEDNMGDMLIATGQATLPAVSDTSYTTYVDLPFTQDQLLLGNKVYVGATLTPSVLVANSLLKVDLVKTGAKMEADLVSNYLSSINTYAKTASESLASANKTLTEIFSSLDTLILTATNSIRVDEISGLDQNYYPANLANSAAVVYTAPLTTQSYIIGMDGYGGIGFSYVNAGTASTTLNIFGTMDRAAAAGSEVYFNINQELDSAASTAGWTVTTSARFTLEDVAGVTGFYKNIRLDIGTTANTTVVLNYKTKQLV